MFMSSSLVKELNVLRVTTNRRQHSETTTQRQPYSVPSVVFFSLGQNHWLDWVLSMVSEPWTALFLVRVGVALSETKQRLWTHVLPFSLSKYTLDSHSSHFIHQVYDSSPNTLWLLCSFQSKLWWSQLCSSTYWTVVSESCWCSYPGCYSSYLIPTVKWCDTVMENCRSKKSSQLPSVLSTQGTEWRKGIAFF